MGEAPFVDYVGVGFCAHSCAAYGVGGEVGALGVGDGDYFDGSGGAEPFFRLLGGVGAGAWLVLFGAASDAADGVAELVFDFGVEI